MSVSPSEKDAVAQLDAAASALERSSVAAAHRPRSAVAGSRPTHSRHDGFAVPAYASPSIAPATDRLAGAVDLGELEGFVRRRPPGAGVVAVALTFMLGLALVGVHLAAEKHAEAARVAELEHVRQSMLELQREANQRAEAEARAGQVRPAAPPSTVAALLAAGTRHANAEAPRAQKPRGASRTAHASASRRSLAWRGPVTATRPGPPKRLSKRRTTRPRDVVGPAFSRSRSRDPI